MKFDKRLREIRQDKGVTQAQLAAKLNVTEGAVRGWENIGREPSYAILIQISKIFDVTTDILLGLDEYLG